MASALLKAVANVFPEASQKLSSTAVAASSAPLPHYKHTYTILMTTPRSATPTFLHQVQQSDLKPVFIGKDGVFFRKDALSNWGWSHVFVLPGEDDAAKLPQNCSVRQKWAFTIGSDDEFVLEDGELSKERFGDQSEFEAQEPQDLVDVTRYWLRIRKNRLFAMTFLNLSDEDGKEKYAEGLEEAKQKFTGMKTHLFGTVKEVEQVVGWGDPAVAGENSFTHFALLSFEAEKEYGAFLVSEEHAKLVGLGKEGMVLTKEMRLPKEQPIDRYGWEYGNPYEPYGEDWFG
ncbi:hypothetical protein BDV96DRAFT_294009 [Lophiotrema nucula]|uniref:Stress-response A/B barrel domain-containing protein n=1 Tax=Lophiotrema nucula TaxID=690887 RepID=A0A6A5YL81_9PLEO|nr:hypothetical protein BDV96DRAFT_294009 [Lophiotrema nucula]